MVINARGNTVETITYGGISVINAIPAFLGGTIAIDLKARIIISLNNESKKCPYNEFVNFITNYTLKRWNLDLSYNDLCINVISEIPPTSGLKSNSAIASGLIYGLAIALGIKISPIDAARIAAEATKMHGSSITGAFDDAAASILGGLVLTDNATNSIIKHLNLNDEYIVIITGFKDKKKKLEKIDRLRSLTPIYKEIFNLALNGDLWRATIINGILVAESLGYLDAIPFISNALIKGAIASGVSGNGPSVFAIFKPGEEGPFIDYVEQNWNYYLVTRFVNIRDFD